MLVSFPNLGINLNLSRIAFSIFGVNIYWYGIIIVTGIIIGLFVSRFKNNNFGIKYNDILELLILVLPISIICARTYYVIFNLNTYLEDKIQIFNIRNGGMAIYGGIIGGVITSYIYCKKKKLVFLDVLDYLAPSLVLAQAIGRWGNFINIEAYGSETNLPWRMGVLESGVYKEVHPTFLYESLGCFIIFIILLLISKKRKFSGEVTFIYLIAYSFIRFFIEGLRIDSLMLGNIRISQLLSILIFITILIIYIAKRTKTKFIT